MIRWQFNLGALLFVITFAACIFGAVRIIAFRNPEELQAVGGLAFAVSTTVFSVLFGAAVMVPVVALLLLAKKVRMAPKRDKPKHEQFSLWEGAKTLSLLCVGTAFYKLAIVLGGPESPAFLAVVAFIGGSIGAVIGHCYTDGLLRGTINWAVIGALAIWIPVIVMFLLVS